MAGGKATQPSGCMVVSFDEAGDVSYSFQVTFDCHGIEVMTRSWAESAAEQRAPEVPRVFDGDDGRNVAILDPEGNEFCIQ